jgi:signal transduction histidine kinase
VMRAHSRAIAAGVALIFFALLGPAAAEPRRVLLLHSFGPHFSPWRVISSRFREALLEQSRIAIDLYEASLHSRLLGETHDERPFIEHLRALFAERRLKLVVAMGAPAGRFFLEHRSEISPPTPLLITGVDEQMLEGAVLTANDAAVTVWFDQAKQIENILQLIPYTTTIAVAAGASPTEKFWVEDLRRAYLPFTNKVTFEWLNELSLDDMVKRVARLPPHSAIYYNHIHVDARGVPYENDRALSRLYEAANAPIFSSIDSVFGHGTVGGPLVSTERIALQTANVAVQILSGEVPNNIEIPLFGLEPPIYDWRELQRWNISEARLPAGSIVQFRKPTAWERYRWQLTGIFLALLVLTALTAWLLMERFGRRSAQLESGRRLSQIIHLNRSAELGALSTSFAHELSQPLSAIMVSADAGESLLGQHPPKDGRVRSVLVDIREAAQHAIDVIQHLRKFMKKSETEVKEFDVNEVIADVTRFLGREATKRSIILRVDGCQGRLLVRADRIHLQQVILNLANNAADAVADLQRADRIITIQTRLLGDSRLEVSVSDSGPGIPEQDLYKVFDTFYTTKKQGTGLGLSIARNIIESFDGRIWAENRPEGGAVFRFTLPLAHAT